MREIAYLTFTEKGRALAETLRAALGGEVSCTRGGVTLCDWTAENFESKRALVYVGAVGIAVRAIAPHVKSKATDPAVVAVDECARYAVPLLSGHLGGANALTLEIARVCGAEAVITTATDRNGLLAFDDWARVHGLAVLNPEKIKAVSSKLLDGGTIAVRSRFPIVGAIPEGVELTDGEDADVYVDIRAHKGLTLVPRALVLGVGCRRGIERETLEQRFQALCEETGVLPEAVSAAATVALKRDEAGLLAFCASHGWPLSVYSAEELAALEGDFTASAFVKETAGVDNVCERAAVKTAGGELIVKKHAGDGVTLALARKNKRLDWSVGHG